MTPEEQAQDLFRREAFRRIDALTAEARMWRILAAVSSLMTIAIVGWNL